LAIRRARAARLMCMAAGLLLLGADLGPAVERVLFRETFADLAAWKPLLFPKIDRHSTYTSGADERGPFLRAESNASASGLVRTGTFDPRAWPVVRWRWKVDGLYRKGDPLAKEGDDFPIRVYVLFGRDPARESFGDKVRFAAARVLYGQSLPGSSLSYVWASRDPGRRIWPSPYADQARMIALEAGPDKIGGWVDEAVDLVADYRQAFGHDPPAEASLAVMNDSDNTGESSVSYLADLEVAGPEPAWVPAGQVNPPPGGGEKR
jgi:hypothetical protein